MSKIIVNYDEIKSNNPAVANYLEVLGAVVMDNRMNSGIMPSDADLEDSIFNCFSAIGTMISDFHSALEKHMNCKVIAQAPDSNPFKSVISQLSQPANDLQLEIEQKDYDNFIAKAESLFGGMSLHAAMANKSIIKL